MIRAWLSDQGFTLGPAIALLLFFGVFIGVLVWIYRPGSKRIYEHESRLPFDDEEAPQGEPRRGAGDRQDTESKED